jgi:predicted DCC family thiol-disulfide oxidoreductase YuxK
MARALVLWDGDCGLCQRTRTVLHGLGAGLTQTWRPLQSGEGERFGLSFETLARSIHVIEGKRVEQGFRAVKMILLRTPGFYLLLAMALWVIPDPFLLVALPLALFFAPPFEPIGERMYRYVAENRSSSCKLPPQ